MLQSPDKHKSISARSSQAGRLYWQQWGHTCSLSPPDFPPRCLQGNIQEWPAVWHRRVPRSGHSASTRRMGPQHPHWPPKECPVSGKGAQHATTPTRQQMSSEAGAQFGLVFLHRTRGRCRPSLMAPPTPSRNIPLDQSCRGQEGQWTFTSYKCSCVTLNVCVCVNTRPLIHSANRKFALSWQISFWLLNLEKDVLTMSLSCFMNISSLWLSYNNNIDDDDDDHHHHHHKSIINL